MKRLAVLLSAFVAASVARAEPVSAPLRAPRATVYFDNHLGGASNDGVSLFGWMPTIGASFRPIAALELGAQIPFALASYQYDPPIGARFDETRMRVANPYFEALFVYEVDKLALRVGGGLTLPGAWIPDDGGTDAFMASLAYGTAPAVRGMLDYWLYAPETLSLVAPAHAVFRPGANVVLRGDVALAVAIPVGGEEATGIFQFEAAGGYDFGMFEAGLRLSGAMLFANDSLFQSALSPYARARFGVLFAQASLILNLDEPFGFAFEKGGFTGGQLLVGTNIE